MSSALAHELVMDISPRRIHRALLPKAAKPQRQENIFQPPGMNMTFQSPFPLYCPTDCKIRRQSHGHI